MDQKYESTMSNLVGSIVYYELQWWTYGAVHVERYLRSDNVLQRLDDLKKIFKERCDEEVQYVLTKCEQVDTNSDSEWYNELLEKESDGYSITW